MNEPLCVRSFLRLALVNMCVGAVYKHYKHDIVA